MATTLAGLQRLNTGVPENSGSSGFRSSTAFDDSPEGTKLVRLAVARAKEGDDDAFRFLYLRYSNNVYGYVRSIVRDDYEAEDITQHVFAKLMTAIVKYTDCGLPFFAWLLRLSKNVAIDHLRSSRTTPSEELSTFSVSRGGQVEDLDDTLTMRDALATLPEDQRQVVFMRHVMGLSPVEIADRMGRTEGSIHGLHHRGRRALQQELARQQLAPATASSRLVAV